MIVNLIIAGVVNLILAILVYKFKALNLKAVVIAFVLGVFVFVYSLFAYIVLLVYFLSAIILEKILLKKEKEKRNSLQVISNIVFAIIALVLFRVTDNAKYLLVFSSVLSVSLCDTVASTTGTKLAKKVYSITKFVELPKGVSGGVSLVGTLSGFSAGLYLSVVCFVVANLLKIDWGIKYSLVVWFGGFAGMLVDSLLGERLQKKYFCNKCNRLSDKKYCCDTLCERIGGFLTNSQVNVVSEGMIFAILVLLI